MGLGAATDRAGAFGQFRDKSAPDGLQSIPPNDDSQASTVTVPVGQTVELTVPAVCLNFGLPSPTFHDKFHLMDVDDYSTNPRVRKALRSLAELGTSQGVAQAAMRNVCNDLPFATMVDNAGKRMNPREIDLAARFVQAVDASTASNRVDPTYLNEGRIFVTVQGEGAIAKEAARLSKEVDGIHILGLPITVAERGTQPTAVGPAIHLTVSVSENSKGETQGRVNVTLAHYNGGVWAPLGKTTFTELTSLSVLDGASLARSLDRAIASAFVLVKPLRKGTSSTILRIENKLPFTLTTVVVKAGDSAGAPSVPLKGMGIGPARSDKAAIQAPTASIERVEINGL